jgi:hypothetical protein
VSDRPDKTESTIIGFRAPNDLVAAVEAAARAEGVSRSDVARRALIRDLTRYGWFPGAVA